MIRDLAKAQREMRQRWKPAPAGDAYDRSIEFRERIVALFMEMGKTREEAEEYHFRAIFGPTIAEIRYDFRVLRELRARKPGGVLSTLSRKTPQAQLPNR